MPFRRELLGAVRSGLPAAALLAAAVGLAVAIGANLSNATPSADKPYGWPGAANFEGGVATVRPELVLATTLPALLLGLRALPAQSNPHPKSALAALAGASLLVPAALLVATLVGALAAAPSPPGAYLAFWVAHSALALSLLALGFLARVVSPRHGPLAGLAAWCLFAVLLDGAVRWQLFRTEGYHNLAVGQLPGWFYAAQVLSPLALYRALLIVWQPGFRDWLEHAALDNATLPSWLDPAVLTPLLILLWFVVPAAIALAILWRRNGAAPSKRLRPLAGDGTSQGAKVAEVLPRPATPTVVVVPVAEPHGRLERRPQLNASERTEAIRMAMRPPRPPPRRRK